MSICRKCGEQLSEGVKFCTNCGTALEVPTPRSQAPTADSVNNNQNSTANQNHYHTQQNIPASGEYSTHGQYYGQTQNTYANPRERSFAPQYVPSNQPAAPAKKAVSAWGYIARGLWNLIPVVGWLVYFIMLFVWSADEAKEDSFRSWAKAQIILTFIGIGLVVAFGIFIATAGITGMNIFSSVAGY